MKKLTPIQKKFVEKLNEVLKRKHIKLVINSKHNKLDGSPICFEICQRNDKIADVCCGWPDLDPVLFDNYSYETVFEMRPVNEADRCVKRCFNDLGLMVLEGCSSYEELLLKLELIS